MLNSLSILPAIAVVIIAMRNTIANVPRRNNVGACPFLLVIDPYILMDIVNKIFCL